MSFDLVTHKRNSKGQINQENHYIRKVVQGVVQYERPPKSGLWYYENGEPVKPEAKANMDEVVKDLVPEVTPKAQSGQPQQATLNSKK